MNKQQQQYESALKAMAEGWTLTMHAKKQCAAKGFDPIVIMAAAGDPSVTYAHGSKYPGQWRYIRDGVVAVVDPKSRRIITAYVDVAVTPLRADQLV